MDQNNQRGEGSGEDVEDGQGVSLAEPLLEEDSPLEPTAPSEETATAEPVPTTITTEGEAE